MDTKYMPVIYPIQRAPEEMIVMSIVSSDYVLGQQFTELIRRAIQVL
jgi:hypothetical protein